MTDTMDVQGGRFDPHATRGPIPVREARSTGRKLASATQRAQLRTMRFGFNAAMHQRARRFARHDLATPNWNPLRTAHALLDELVMVYFETLSEPMPADEFLRVEREVDELIELWDSVGVRRDPASLHEPPTPPDDARIENATFAGLDGETMTFTSGWEPHPLAPGRTAWLAQEYNHKVPVNLLRHGDGPRPWLVLVHGADMGRSFDARILRAKYFHETLGVDVAMPVLPTHGPRGHMPATRAAFPTDDHVANVHGLTQALADVRRTIAWIRTQDPTAIGVYGFSLGGCVGSLLACTETELDAVVMGCPAADLVDLIRINSPGPIREQPRMHRLLARAEQAAAPVTAFQLEPTLPVDRLALISAHADRLADPVFQVGRLWHHLGRPELRAVDSGHVSYFMRRRWVDLVAELLVARGVGEPG